MSDARSDPALRHRLDAALVRARRGDCAPLTQVADAEPRDQRDGYETLLRLHALHVAPVAELRGAEWFQHHPSVAALKLRLEQQFLAELDEDARARPSRVGGDPGDPVAAVRRVATANLVPPIYDWVAEQATLEQLVDFLAVEGGPDGGFDDLVALAQLGLDGLPKVTLAGNYWDEMGRGEPAAVHTELHRRLSRALGLTSKAAVELPTAALRRSVLNGVLATNRALQPEMLGALGVLELQAGPRCRRVIAGLARVGAPDAAFPFYAEHAETDPRHGKEWVDGALVPLARAHPGWGPRFARGAVWRCTVNDDLFAVLFDRIPKISAPVGFEGR